MEASLLPCAALTELGRRVMLVALCSTKRSCVRLRREFSIPLLNSWVVVLDHEGETLASWVGDAAGAGCNERSASEFADNLVGKIERSLLVIESVQELERRWKRAPFDPKALEAYSRRLSGMMCHGKLRRLYRQAAQNRRFSREQRDEFGIRLFLTKVEDFATRPSSAAQRDRFIRQAEKLIVRYAHCRQAENLVSALFRHGHAHRFDFPGVSARSIERLKRRAATLPNPAMVQRRIRQLARIRRECITQYEEFVQKQSDPETKRRFAALMGDPEAAFELAKQPGGSNDRYEEWAREARNKLGRKR